LFNVARTHRAAQFKRKIGLAIGRFALQRGPRFAATSFGISIPLANYWKLKLLDPHFHPASHGGRRYTRFNSLDVQLITHLVWNQCQIEPRTSRAEYVDMLRRKGYIVSKQYLSSLFHKWRWSFHYPTRTQLKKYTTENMLYYVEYMAKVKYFDEASFCPRELARRKALGPKNFKLIVVDGVGLNEPPITVSVLVSVSDPVLPVKCTMKEETNDQYDFLATIIQFIEAGYLVQGDILILDNARIHDSLDIWDPLTQALERHQIQMIFLPKYSPELNPCELVHAFVKKYLRDHSLQLQQLPLWARILKGISKINVENVLNFYCHCTQYKTK